MKFTKGYETIELPNYLKKFGIEIEANNVDSGRKTGLN